MADEVEWSDIPREFAPLVPLIKKWSIEDSDIRYYSVSRSSASERFFLIERLSLGMGTLHDWLVKYQSRNSHDQALALTVSWFYMAIDYLPERLDENVARANFDPEKLPSEAQCIGLWLGRFGFKLDEIQKSIISRLFPHERVELIYCADHIREKLDAWLVDNEGNTEVADEEAALRNLLKAIEFAEKVEADQAV